MSNSTPPSIEAQSYHYWAFLSYSHQDNLPVRGEPMPERFFPAFRDEAELPFHPSSFHLHPCAPASPRSARSRYVNEEVRHFRQLGHGDRILTLIVDDEPNVRSHPRSGLTAGDHCFCPSLVHPLGSARPLHS